MRWVCSLQGGGRCVLCGAVLCSRSRSHLLLTQVQRPEDTAPRNRCRELGDLVVMEIQQLQCRE